MYLQRYHITKWMKQHIRKYRRKQLESFICLEERTNDQ